MVNSVEITQVYITVEIGKLKQHPHHREFYGDLELLKDVFVKSIADRGIIDTPYINHNFEIITGYRRILAWKQSKNNENDKVKVFQLQPQPEIMDEYLKAEKDIIIECNCHREKTWMMRAKEIQYLFEKYKGRVGKPNSQYQFFIENSTSSLSDIRAMNHDDYNKLMNEYDKVEGEKGRTRIIVSKKVGLNASFVDYVNKVNLKDLEVQKALQALDVDNWTQNEFVDYVKAHIRKDNETPLLKKSDSNKDIIKLNIKTDNIDKVESYIIEDKLRLYRDDSKNLSFIENESVDLICTSPPYADMRNYGKDPNNVGLLKDKEEIREQYTKIFKELYRVSKPTTNFFLNVGDKHFNGELFDFPNQLKTIAIDCGFILKNIIIYHKSNYKTTNSKTANNMSYEFIYHLVKDLSAPFYHVLVPSSDGKIKVQLRPKDYKKDNTVDYSRRRFVNPGLRKIPDFWYDGFVAVGKVADGNTFKKFGIEDTEHIAQFPLAIPFLSINEGSKVGDVVLDPFSGSGNTGIIALQLGRKYIGVEIEEEYFECSKTALTDTLKSIL